MKKCFVMQPFDGGTFDKRYEDVFEPAISEAGLEPYRVDRDLSVSIPIDEIESGIRSSEICFAEITTDNPNVWFELGFAIAVPKEVVLVCAEDRKSRFPFDVQHRNIIKYKTDAPQDFVELKGKVTKRILAILKKQEEIGKVTSISPIKDTEGLSEHEIVALVTVTQNEFISQGGMVPAARIIDDLDKAGYTGIAASLALKSLSAKGMVKSDVWQDYDNDRYTVFAATENGETWLMKNQDKLVLKKPVEDEIPF